MAQKRYEESPEKNPTYIEKRYLKVWGPKYGNESCFLPHSAPIYFNLSALTVGMAELVVAPITTLMVAPSQPTFRSKMFSFLGFRHHNLCVFYCTKILEAQYA